MTNKPTAKDLRDNVTLCEVFYKDTTQMFHANIHIRNELGERVVLHTPLPRALIHEIKAMQFPWEEGSPEAIDLRKQRREKYQQRQLTIIPITAKQV